MSNPLTHGFRNLTRFSGRDRRGVFWPHAGQALLLSYAAMVVGMVVMMEDLFGDLDLLANLIPFFGVLGGGIVLAVFLLAAAISRRLHDIGRSARWGLVPVVFLVSSLCGFPLLMQNFVATGTMNTSLFGLIFLSNMLYLGTLVALAVFLALPGQAGTNRFGEQP